MDFSWSEMMLVGVVALIVIGPKDLPGMFRELGRITAKLRSMAREFSRAMEQAAKETGVKDVADDLKKVANPAATGLDAVKSAADKFEKWDPLKTKITPTAPTTATTSAAATTAAATTATPAAATTTEAAPVASAMGPATAALAEQQAARKAVAAEAAEKLRKVSTPAATSGETEPAARKPGRTRKKADPAAGETA